MKIFWIHKKNRLGMHSILIAVAVMVAFSIPACKTNSIDRNEAAYTKQKPVSPTQQTNEELTVATASSDSAEENMDEDIKEGSFRKITGSDFFDSINYIHVIDVQEGVFIDASFDEFINDGLIDMINSLHFYEPESGVVNGEKYLYQVEISNGEKEYFVDIYDNKDGYNACLNNKWETMEDAGVFGNILETLGNYSRQVNTGEEGRLTDGEVLSNFYDAISDSINKTLLEIKAGRHYICDEQFRITQWNTDFTEVNGYKEVDFSKEQLSQILLDIKECYVVPSSNFVKVAGSDVVINAEFIVMVSYDDYA